MSMQPQKKRFVIFMPSGFSLIASGIVSLFMIATTFWDKYINFPFSEDYLISLNYVKEYLQKYQGVGEIFNESVLSTPLMNNLLFFVFWLFLGMTLYYTSATLYIWLKDIHSTVNDKSFYYRNKTRITRIKQLADRMIVRIVALFLWVIYIVVFIQLLVPASLLNIQIAIELGWRENWYLACIGVVTLFLSTYLHGLFCRLLALRFRVFGNVSHL